MINSHSKILLVRLRLTDFNVSTCIKQHVVALNVTVNDVLTMEMGEAFAGLSLALAKYPCSVV